MTSRSNCRFERDLHLTTKGRPASSGETTLHAYLAELAAQQEAEDAVEDVAPEVETDSTKGGGLSRAGETGRVVGAEDIAPDPDADRAAP
jgi:hypothetical protein